MMRMKRNIERIYAFLLTDIWRITATEVSPVKKFGYDILKIIVFTIERFFKNRIINKASALTYSTLLATVPILAIVFAIAKGFGFSQIVEEIVRANFSGEPMVVDYLIIFSNSYIEHTKSGVFLGVGVLLLLWTVILLTSNIERTFNRIWLVKKPRSIFRTITDYTAILLLLPIIIVASSGLSIFMTTMINQTPDYALLNGFMKGVVRTVPFVLTGLMFTGLYIFMPNTPVKFKCAIVPGFIAGACFQFLQYFYITSQIWVSSYNAIYGSFAAIPLFMLLTQLSWTICLFGAELSYANQNIEIYAFGKDANHASRRYHDFLCILIMSLICKRFQQRNCKGYTANELASAHHIPLRLVNDILYELLAINLIAEITHEDKEERARYIPAEDINNLSVGVLLSRINRAGSENFKVDRNNKFAKQWGTLRNAQKMYYDELDKVLLKDL